MCEEFKFKGLLSLQVESFKLTFKSMIPTKVKASPLSANELPGSHKCPRTSSFFFLQESFGLNTISSRHLKSNGKYNVNVL